MPSRKPARTTRRLLQIASLGFAALLAGLLSGCSASQSTYTLAAANTQNLHTSPADSSYRQKSFETRPIPDLRHPPVPHRTESWADRTPHQPAVSGPFNPGRTLINYDFTDGHSPSNSSPGHFAVQ